MFIEYNCKVESNVIDVGRIPDEKYLKLHESVFIFCYR